MSNKKDATTTVADYIKQQNNTLSKIVGVKPNHSKKSTDPRIILITLLAMAFVFSYLLGSKINTSAARKYLDSQVGSITSITDLTYKNTYQIYERQSLGNDINTSLNGGFTYGTQDLTVAPSSDGTQTIVTTANGSFVLYDGVAKSINFYNGTIYFITPTHQLMYSDMSGNIAEVSDVPQAIRNAQIMDGILYFQTESNDIARYNLETKETATVTSDSVKSFACIGQDILYLTFSRDLKVLHSAAAANASAGNTLAHNIDKFFYNGDIIAQNADKITSFEADGTHPKTLVENIQDVVGADYGHVLYQKDDVIYDFNTLEDETLSLSNSSNQGVVVGVDKFNSSWFLINRSRASNDYLYECSSLN